MVYSYAAVGGTNSSAFGTRQAVNVREKEKGQD